MHELSEAKEWISGENQRIELQMAPLEVKLWTVKEELNTANTKLRLVTDQNIIHLEEIRKLKGIVSGL